jgi:hypothetical protein
MPRRRGAQPGNKNALKHGKYSVPLRAARLADRRATWAEQQRRSDEWIATVPATDYAAICDKLLTLRRAKREF